MCLKVRELSGSLALAQQQLAAAQSVQAADTATAEQRLKLLQQQLAAAEAGLMRRMTGAWCATGQGSTDCLSVGSAEVNSEPSKPKLLGFVWSEACLPATSPYAWA